MKDQIFNAFNQIHAEEALIEKTLEGMYSYREKRSRRAFFSQRGMALAVSFAMMLCIGVTGINMYFTEAFALSVDVNPSIEMKVNRFDKVISAKGINAEGEEIVSAVNIKHTNYAEAVNSLLKKQTDYGYLEDDGTVLVALACHKKEKATEVKETIDTVQAELPQTVAVIEPKKTVVEEAEKHDMSFGKYQAALDIEEVTSTVTTAEVKDMSVQEIAEIMNGDTTTKTGIAISSSSGSTAAAAKDAASTAGTSANTTVNNTAGSGTSANTSANTSATPKKDTSATTSATPANNSTTSTGTSSGSSGKNPVTNNNNTTSGSADKTPATGTNKDNASDKAPENDENAPVEQPSGGTDSAPDSAEMPVADTADTDTSVSE